MIVFLYGPDSYRRNEKVKELTAAYSVNHPLIAMSRFDFRDASGQAEEAARFEDFVSGQSLFASLRFAVVSGLFDSDASERLRNVIASQLNSDSIIILVNESGTPPVGYEFLNVKPARAQFFGELHGDKMVAFLAKEAVRKGVNISLEELRRLAKVYSGDTWGAVNELAKIQLAGAYIEEIVHEDFLPLMNVLASRRRATAKLPALERCFLRKEEAGKIFNLLALLLARHGERVVQMADYDVAVKSGKTDYETALLDFCLQF